MGADLEYVARLDASQVKKELSKIDKDVEKLAKDADKSFKQLGSGLDKDMALTRQRQAEQYRELGAAAATAFGIIAGYSVDAVANAREAIGAEAQLAAAITSTGGAAGQSLEALKDHAGALQKITNFSDDAVMEGQGLLLTFTNIKETFPEATTTMLDMSEAMDQSLKSSAVQLGKALNDPIKGIGALTRIGVTFTKEQKEMIKAMVEAGDVAGAQRLILAELNREFGGSAEAARIAAGAQKDLEVSTGELSEAWGKLILAIGDAGATGALVGFLDTLAGGADAWTATIERIQRTQVALGDLKPSFDLTVEDLNKLTRGLTELNPFVILTNGVKGFYKALGEGKDFFDSWRSGLESMLAGAEDLISSTLSIFSNADENLTRRPPLPPPATIRPTPTTPTTRGPVPAGTSRQPIRRRQAGGPVSAGFPYTVGEAGPELFVPSTSGAIIPNNPLIMSNIGQPSMVNNIQNVRGGTQITLPDVAGILGNPIAVAQIRNLIAGELDGLF